MTQTYWKEKWETIGRAGDVFTNLGRRNFDYKSLVKYLLDINNALELKKHDVLMDIGCANGLITALLLPFVHKAKGVDYSRTSIEKAKKMFTGIDNLTFEESDILKIDLRGYNKILVGSVFQYLKKQKVNMFFKKLSSSDVELCCITHVPYLPKQNSFLEGYKEIIDDTDKLKEAVDIWLNKNTWYLKEDFSQLEKNFQVEFITPNRDLVQFKYSIDVMLRKK